ncbi:MAG: hypothetical protein FWC46_09780 [Actinomycetia bacterium]|nr:hypothetical protein [Actinomycetes bacterium]
MALASPSPTKGVPPAGVAASPGGPANAHAQSNFPKNKDGLSYGSVLDASSPEQEPDLVLVVATNGKTGYVRQTDLAAAEGANVSSPEEAVAWQKAKDAQAAAGHGATVIPVYDSDGTTKVGVFVVGPQQAQGNPPAGR